MFEDVLKNYSYDVNTKVWQRSEYEGIAYCDGQEVEQRLKRIVSDSEDVSLLSVELATKCTDWPSCYHLSSQRANLLRPLEEQLRGKHVLEIGAGCGALTRYLGEIDAEVLALEGSPHRASIAALRCVDLPNVSVVAEAIHNFDPIPQYDVVTLIGVLEYARMYFPGVGRDPVDALLTFAIRLLKPGGRLILAIENQLGLKYFAGFPEDHMGQAMFGIEDRYSMNGVVTFGRRELGQRLNRAGLPVCQWWYPFPDYKFPSLMVSDQGVLPRDDMDLTPLIRQACACDLQYPLQVSFNLERAWRPIVRNGLLGEVANSFLLVASNSEVHESQTPPIAIHYATANRYAEFTKKVVFTRTEEGAPLALPIALYPQATSRMHSMVRQHLKHQTFLQGQVWQDCLTDILTSPGWTIEHIQQWFQVWLKAFYSAVGVVGGADIMNKKIPGICVDMTPRNLMVDQDGTCTFFDQEWEYAESIEVGYMVFRALLSSVGSLRNISKPFDQTNTNPLTRILKIAESVGFSFSNQNLKQYMALEDTFQKCVGGGVSINGTAVNVTEESDDANVPIQGSRKMKDSNPLGFVCSIIIPVCNKDELTKQCLTQLAKVTTDVRYEVIVVDNASTDGTKEFLSTLGGDVQVLTNQENLGFAKACNQGAAVAKGEYVVFLNNDTIPQAQWLSALVHEIEGDKEVGIVGSKLLYPDNTLQHAGIVLSRNDGSPYMFLQGLPGNKTVLNMRREFQAVTSACMLVRKGLFHNVGGFDERYVNEFEDIDLCLKVRAKKKKIIYQPKSWLYRIEGQASGMQEYDKEDFRRFSQRWRHQWIGDEDSVAFERGIAVKLQVGKGESNTRGTVGVVELKKIFVVFSDGTEQERWQRVRDVQALLLGNEKGPWTGLRDGETIRQLLGDPEEWPTDLGVLEWAIKICQTLKCQSEAQQFLRKQIILL